MPSVLVVDDSPMHRTLVRDAMAPEGWHVEEADTGEDGLRRAMLAHDVVLLDFVLPDMDGLVVMHELRRRGIPTPVVAFTAQGSEDLAARFLATGAVDYLPKDHLTPLRILHTLTSAAGLQSVVVRALRPEVPEGPLDEGGAWRDVSTRGKRVLVADDTRFFRAFVRDALAADGWVVDEAADGAAALAKAKEGDYDAIVLDFLLPGMDGGQVLAALQASDVRTPVVVATAHGDEATASRLLQLGAVDFLAKDGLSLLRLKRTMRNALWLRSPGR